MQNEYRICKQEMVTVEPNSHCAVQGNKKILHTAFVYMKIQSHKFKT